MGVIDPVKFLYTV